MAFNPFSYFRENKKGALVALTILTMIIFIGQFGQGDPVGRLMSMFGAGRASGEVVTTLYGKKVREGDISQTNQKRRVASEFLFTMSAVGHPKVLTELNKTVGSPSEGAKLAGVKKILTEYQQTLQMLTDPRGILRQLAGSPGFLQQFLGRNLQQTDDNLRLLEVYLGRDKLSDEEKSIIDRSITLLGAQRAMLLQTMGLSLDGERFGRDNFYFGGTSKPEDILDFRLWLIQADRLGINLTEEDVLRAISSEAAGADVVDLSRSFSDQDQVKAFLRPLRRNERVSFTPSELLAALRDEFRVVIAQSVLLGSEPGMRGYRSVMGASSTPSLATPDEFLRFMKDHRTTYRVKLFPVSAADFLSKVKGQPSESEIDAFYDRAAKLEPNPEVREPGYKRPRRITVEYVVASPDDPYYVDQARKDAQLLRKLSSPDARLGSLLIGATIPNFAAVAALSLDPLYSDIEKLLFDDPNQQFKGANPELRADFVWFHWRFNPVADEVMRGRLHATSFIGSESPKDAKAPRSTLGIPIAALVGGAQTSPLDALVGLYTAATGEELRQSIPFNLTLLLSQSDPQHLFGAAALAVQKLPPMVPRSLIEPQVVAAREKTLAAETVQGQMRKMQEELTKLSKKPKEARDYINKAVKEYRLSIYTMPAPNSEFGIVEDLRAKKNLNLDVLRKALGNEQAEQIRGFANSLFRQTSGEYQPEGPARSPDAKQEVLYWRSFDKPAEERKLSVVRDEVIAAWRLEEARKLAREQAESIEAEINKLKSNPAEVERFLKQKGLTTSFELDNISQLVAPAKETLPARNVEFRPYQVPPEKADVLPYPPFDLAKRITRLTRPGDASVIPDRPAKNYFVTLLLDRNEPTLDDFRSVYARRTGETLYQRFLSQRRADYRKSVVEQLRREAAGELDKDGRFKLPDVVKREESPSQEAD